MTVPPPLPTLHLHCTHTAPTLTLWPIPVLIFYDVSGSPFGTAPSINANNSFYSILGFLLFPIVSPQGSTHGWAGHCPLRSLHGHGLGGRVLLGDLGDSVWVSQLGQCHDRFNSPWSWIMSLVLQGGRGAPESPSLENFLLNLKMFRRIDTRVHFMLDIVGNFIMYNIESKGACGFQSFCNIMRWRWLKNYKTERKTIFANIKRDTRGRGVDLMKCNALAIKILLWCQRFFVLEFIVIAFAKILSSHNWFHFGIVSNVVMLGKILFWRFSKDFLSIRSCGCNDIVLTHDSDTKK